MKEKRECKLVQDLLPNYIEKVISEETNQYMEEHLQSCAECNKVYTSMTKEIKSKALDTDKSINYMKKVNQKLKIAKIALESIAIMILLSMLAFGANTLRNYRILEELRQTLKETQKISDYHLTTSFKIFNYGMQAMDIYRKGEKGVSIAQVITTYGQKYKTTSYFKGNRCAMYKEGNNGEKYEKTVEIDENYQLGLPQIGNWFLEEPETEGGTSKLWLSTRVKIGKTTYQGKECYVIENDRFSKDPNEHIIYYIEKDTGLIVRQIQNDINTDYSYEFGNVDDEIFKEPNIEEYEMIEK
ncbi:MAG: hypothetical protein HFJ31_00570 [Clostridia bacterium]|nr:hypothetical protein [Clostridia bacterium]